MKLVVVFAACVLFLTPDTTGSEIKPGAGMLAYQRAHCKTKSLEEELTDGTPTQYDNFYKMWQWLLGSGLSEVLQGIQADIASAKEVTLNLVEKSLGDILCIEAEAADLELRATLTGQGNVCRGKTIDENDPDAVVGCLLDSTKELEELRSEVLGSDADTPLAASYVGRIQLALLRITYGLAALEDALEARPERDLSTEDSELIRLLRKLILNRSSGKPTRKRPANLGEFLLKQCDASSMEHELEDPTPLTIEDVQAAVNEANFEELIPTLQSHLEGFDSTNPSTGLTDWLEQEWKAEMCESMEPIYALKLEIDAAGTATPPCDPGTDPNDPAQLVSCLGGAVGATLSTIAEVTAQVSVDSPWEYYYKTAINFCRGMGRIMGSLELLDEALTDLQDSRNLRQMLRALKRFTVQ